MESFKWCLLVAMALTCQFGLAPGQEGVKTWRKGGGGVKGSHDTSFLPGNGSGAMIEATGAGRGQNQSTTLDLHRSNESLSALDRFMNKTKSEIPSGVCFEELPTVSLLKNDHRGEVPLGNGSNPSLSRVQVCCAGYERNVHNFRKCEPICAEPCQNGLCVGPNSCECYPDFVRNGQGKCVPTCPIGCDHGDCAPGSGVCNCHAGYELERPGGKLCVPKCTGGCGEGRCVGVERCECGKGYEFDPQLKCAPKCAGGCEGGKCVAPEVCACDAGYEKTDAGCEPVCSNGCFHGVCSAPETCTCKPGYKLTDGQCSASCDQPCLNGECTGPNVCTCNRAYTVDVANPFHCVPHCPTGCPNGVCSGPNMCLCNAGYVKDRSLKGSQVCVKRYDTVKS